MQCSKKIFFLRKECFVLLRIFILFLVIEKTLFLEITFKDSAISFKLDIPVDKIMFFFFKFKSFNKKKLVISPEGILIVLHFNSFSANFRLFSSKIDTRKSIFNF